MQVINGQPRIDALRQVPHFAKLPDERLQWLSEQGKDVWLQPGDIHRAEGEPADYVFILLEGEMRITQKVDNQEILLAIYKPKTLYGELPVLMGTPLYWASGRALKPSHIFELPKGAFWQLLSTCSCVTTAILQTMAERMRSVESLSQHREKLVALGTLASGLAHELNNPASACRGAARQLRETFQVLQPLTLKLSQHPQMTSSQQAFLSDLQHDVTLMQRHANTRATTSPLLEPLTQSDREDEVIDWLERHGVADAWKLAPTLVGAGLDTVWLDRIESHIPHSALGDVLTWLEASLTGAGLLDEIEHSNERICNLVQAVKDYSYMDQAPLQEVDIHDGLESTLTILGHKLKQGVLVIRDYDEGLPRIWAYGSELNQVWTNLIDNAIDAMSGRGQVWIRTLCENDCVLVEIADNGPGIPAEIQSHIFEPFFTTKGVGQGTGLGLHIVYRVIVEQHRGDIRIISQPGDTRFQVRLPVKCHKTKI